MARNTETNRTAGKGRRALARTAKHNAPALATGQEQTAPGSAAWASATAARAWFDASNAYARVARAEARGDKQGANEALYNAEKAERFAVEWENEETRRARNGR